MEKIETLKKWNRALELMVSGNADGAEDYMEQLIETIKDEDEVGSETKKEINEFMTELDENYRESIEKIDEDTSERTKKDLRERSRRYMRLNQWRVGELYQFLRSLLYEEGFLPEVEE